MFLCAPPPFLAGFGAGGFGPWGGSARRFRFWRGKSKRLSRIRNTGRKDVICYMAAPGGSWTREEIQHASKEGFWMRPWYPCRSCRDGPFDAGAGSRERSSAGGGGGGE